MALTIEQIQENITNKRDLREVFNQLADYIQDNPVGGDSGYLVYTALLSESGGVVTPTVLHNTLGETVTWALNSNDFYGTIPGGFDATKTIVFGCAGNNEDGNGGPYFFYGSVAIFPDDPPFTGSVYCSFLNTSSQPVLGFVNASIEIRIYP